MNVLLDTHIVLWWLTDDPTLSEDVKSTVDREPGVFVSAATVWEVAIKQKLGKIGAPDDLLERIRTCGFRALPIGYGHAVVAGRLPLIHRDPFDRMLVAQAQCENLALITRDADIQKYEVSVLPA